MPELVVVTTSFNKGKYLPELKKALESQTYGRKRFQWWIMENSTNPETRELAVSWRDEWTRVTLHDFTEDERKEKFVHPYLLNEALGQLEPEQSFIHISDDDLPEPEFLATLAGFLRYNREKNACYVPMRQIMVNGDVVIDRIPSALVIFGGPINPRTNADGNTVMFRASALQALGRPWPEKWEVAATCDGFMLELFCQKDRIWPASSEVMLNHRITELSSFMNSRLGPRMEYVTDPLFTDIFPVD